ncbi:MAG: biotin--[acetyl-CoA-carboxylase] ligase [Clostridiales bacterium]|nr:biotin--[acetyl-CoA-carboxylase] ligase [Clostridiales bacterium]
MSTSEKVYKLLDDKRGEYVSGNEIAKALDISRNAVWKAVNRLTEQGFMISARQNAGYSLSRLDDGLSAEFIKNSLDGDIGIYLLKETESTNEFAKDTARKYPGQKAVIIAEKQTAGKGRRGRSFYSPAGKGLYISFLLWPALSADKSLIITSAAAVAAARAIDSFVDAGEKVLIKWVNDLYLNSRKIGGILTEASVNCEDGQTEYIVIGIGINVYKDIPPREISEVYGAVFGETAGGLRNRLACKLISNVLEITDGLEKEYDLTRRRVINECRARSCVLGKEVNVYGFDGLTRGRAVDIDENGVLTVEDKSGRRFALLSGEVSVRP